MRTPMNADERDRFEIADEPNRFENATWTPMNETALKPPMSADERRLELDKLTDRIIACIYKVSNTLGCGFLEKVYENALAIELRKAGLRVEQQRSIKVYYEGAVVGEFIADILVEECIILELKAAKALDEVHFAQCLNYLRGTGLSVCLLINFGRPRAQVRRVVNNF